MSTSAFPVFDGHNDTLLNLHLEERGGGRSFFVESDQGHIDLPRAKRGGFAGGFFAIFVPPIEMEGASLTAPRPSSRPPINRLDPEHAKSFTLEVIDRLYRVETESAGGFKVVRSIDQLESSLADGVVAAVLHFEGAEAIHPDLIALQTFYDVELRSLGLVWSRPNAL